METFDLVRFGHGRLVNSNEVQQRLEVGRKNLQLESPILFSSEPAILHDYSQRFVKESFSRPHFAASSVVKSQGDRVEGVIIKTTAIGVEILDKAEGVYENHYILTPAVITLNDGLQIEVPIYVAHPTRVLPQTHSAFGKPHPEYLLAILSGGKVQGFSNAYLKRIAAIARQPAYREYVICIAKKDNDTQILDYMSKLLSYVAEI